MSYDAVLLTGGRARRLGGVRKAELVVGGRSLGRRAATAVADASRLIVVGPCPEGIGRVDVVTREEPPGSGPVAAIAAGALHVLAPEVVVLAVDQPFLTPAAVSALRTALAGADVAMPVDGGGIDQPLCAAWRSPALRAALAAVGDPSGMPVRRLPEAAGSVARLTALAAEGRPPPWFDCDTPADLAQAEGWA